MVVRVNRNPGTLHERIETLAARFGVPTEAINTAYTEQGPTGVGSEPVVTLQFPRVAVIAGAPVSTRGYGHTWYTLEREFGLRFTGLRAERISRLQLANYDVIILPPGSSSGYALAFGENGAEKLSEWVSSGGVLIGIAGGAEYLAGPKLDFTSARLIGAEDDDDDDDDDEGDGEGEGE